MTGAEMYGYPAFVEVELPGWDDEKPFKAKLRRPSVLTMAATGMIPNELMGAAQKLFSEGVDTSLPLDQLGKLLRAVAECALVEPTLTELESGGCTLTDMQLAAIYGFTQAGVRALEPFRSAPAGAGDSGDEQTVLGKTE